jgi:hypothetical protein
MAKVARALMGDTAVQRCLSLCQHHDFKTQFLAEYVIVSTTHNLLLQHLSSKKDVRSKILIQSTTNYIAKL